MAHYKLTECEICGAITVKDSGEFHLRWHSEMDGLRAMRGRAAAIARSGSSEQARATAAVILSAVTE